MGKLVATLGVDALPLTQGNAERLPTEARLTGNTTWADGTAWSLVMIGTVDEAERDVLSLSLAASTARGFVALRALVPGLPQSRVPSVDAPGTMRLGDSVLADLGAAAGRRDGGGGRRRCDAAAAVPELGGMLVLTGTPLAALHRPRRRRRSLRSTGRYRSSAAMRRSPTKVDLMALGTERRAASGTKMADRGSGRSLTTATVDTYSLDKPQPLISSVVLVLTLTIDTGADTRRRHGAAAAQRHVWDIDGRVDPVLTLSDGIVALMRLFPGPGRPHFRLPPGVAALDAFGLSAAALSECRRAGHVAGADRDLYIGATMVSADPSHFGTRRSRSS